MTKTKKAYPIDGDILNSDALARVYAQNSGTYFLPQAYPEAGPQHPTYPSGHATMAGACATILKAAFDGSASFKDLRDSIILQGSDDGSKLEDTGLDPRKITIDGEINKLASNIGVGRNWAGIHWRSDYAEGLRLGEKIAISILRDQRNNYPGEDFEGFAITTFDGEAIVV
jgi:PAP2 superfamily